jgi:hypothetical protein
MIDALQWSSENGAYDFHTNHYRILRAIGTMLPMVSGAIHRYCNANHIANMGQALDRIKQYDIDFGHVYASSGLGRLLPQFQGRSDWAILAINGTNVPAKNKARVEFSRFRPKLKLVACPHGRFLYIV